MLENFNINLIIIQIISLLFAVTVHEVAHGYVAYIMGDNTAKLAGRLTFNPIKHLDAIGSFFLPLILALVGSPFVFGYAKPVPVNFAHIRHFKKGVIFVSSAGIAANLCLATMAGFFFQILSKLEFLQNNFIFKPFVEDLFYLLFYSVIINLSLAIFNMIPVPPLDGSRIVSMFLPDDLRRQYAQIERFGMVIIFALLMTNSLSKIILFFLNPLSNFLLGGLR
jgi:Zn-dependent protease